ncbi:MULTISPECIES: GNAT family N-acetyltransferase [unclassified Lentilitoribacter]|jgi:RimJ/RimL family protein N-acetyltransferase|uniref:GNAT family N-acetyltransferase n=1 Tax=unclassified Lentilitoribacter TaxID=2647570 RepID=UPI0013A6EF74|nr:GNAT family N-acetyltransferase [Lentilitoribacter sp. Alg239-R112]
MFKAVQTDSDIDRVVSLANLIWHDHYDPIVGSDQVTYMLEHFHSPQVIKNQIENEGYRYFLIGHNGRIVGYMGVQPNDNELFLSKLYILSTERSKGLGRTSMSHIVDLAFELKLDKVRLTVNKNNIGSIKAYEKMGFKKTDTVVEDIGGGYVMDDYEMELTLT